MKPVFFAAALWILPGVTFAQSAESLTACMRAAETQAAMTECSGEEAKRVDAELDLLVQQLVTVATENGNQPAVIKILSTERAWAAYRDAYLEAMYPAADKQVEYGSVYPMEVNLLRARLTRNHMEELRRMLERYQAAR